MAQAPATNSTSSNAWLNSERWIAGFLVFAFASGALAHLLPTVREVTTYTTDFFLLLSNGLILYALFQRNGDRRLWWWLIAAYLFTFAAEAVGVATGQIFGEYAYGSTMRWQYQGVPFVIALNWVVLTLAANQIVGERLRSPRAIALGAGVVLALYDVAIEPVAIELDYWQWANGAIPLQNYLAWALVAAIISWPLQHWNIRFSSPLLIIYFWAQLAFFLTLNLAL